MKRIGSTLVTVVLAAGLVAACGGDDFRRNLDHGFPSGIGVPPGADAEVRTNLRWALENFHMTQADAECMVTQAFTPAPIVGPDGGYSWTAGQLDDFADRCHIDVSKLWYMTD